MHIGVRHQGGFSLMEVLIVIAIVGFLGSMVSLGGDFVVKQQIRNTSREFLAELQKVRQDALTKRSGATDLGFGLRFASNAGYILFEFEDIDGEFDYDDAGEESGGVSTGLPFNMSVTIGADGDPAGSVLIYDHRGVPRNPDWSVMSGRTFVFHHPNLNTPRCVEVATAWIKEGTWDGAKCSLN